MNTLGKLLLVALITISFTSCLVHPRPYKKWAKRHNNARLHRGNNYGGRHFWVRQY